MVTPAVVRFEVLGQAQPKGSARAFLPKGTTRPIVTTANPNLKDWERSVGAALATVVAQTPPEILAALFAGPVLVAIEFHLARPASLPRKVRLHTKKPDLDKLVRGTIDALSRVLIRDDNQVVEIRARKVYAEAAALARIRVERIE